MALLWTLFYPRGEALAAFWIVEITLHALAQGGGAGPAHPGHGIRRFRLALHHGSGRARSQSREGRHALRMGVRARACAALHPTFQGSYVLISEAQAARGLELRGAGFARVRRMMPILVAMIVTSLRASEQLGRANRGARPSAPPACAGACSTTSASVPWTMRPASSSRPSPGCSCISTSASESASTRLLSADPIAGDSGSGPLSCTTGPEPGFRSAGSWQASAPDCPVCITDRIDDCFGNCVTLT